MKISKSLVESKHSEKIQIEIRELPHHLIEKALSDLMSRKAAASDLTDHGHHPTVPSPSGHSSTRRRRATDPMDIRFLCR